MAELTCPICRRVVLGPLCPTCGVPPEAAPAVAAPTPPTREEQEAQQRAAREAARADREVPRLPERLREDHRFVEWIPVMSAEADLYVVEVVATGERRVLKRYRREQPPRPDDALPREQRERIERMFREDVDRRRSELRAVLEQVREVDDAHIIAIHDFDVLDAERPWELLEHVGGTLEDLVEERTAASEPLTLDEVRAVVEELARALVAIHAKDLIHGDIKPANVLVRDRDPLDLVLTDFGSMVLLHTSAYIDQGRLQLEAANVPPELMPAARTAKGDVAQVGGIALRLLRTLADGGPDLRTAGLDEVLAAVLVGRRRREERLRWLLLQGALHPDPEERWSSTELLDWALGRAVRDVRQHAVPEPAPAPAQAPAATPVPEAAPARRPPPTIGTRPPGSPFEMAQQIAADPEGWRTGRGHLVEGRLQIWADEAMPPLGQALGRDGRLARIADADLRLLEVLLWIEPELPPTFAGWSLTPDGVVELLDATFEPVGRGAGPIGEGLIDHLASSTPPAAWAQARRPDDTEATVAARAVARLTRDERPAREPLRELIGEVARRRSELEAAAEQLALGGAVEGLHRPLLDEVARRLAGRRVRSTGLAAVLRRRRATWSVLRGCSPAVRAVLLDALPVATPLQDAGRAVRRAFVPRPRRPAPSLRVGIPRPAVGGRTLAVTAVVLAIAPMLLIGGLRLVPEPTPSTGPAPPPSIDRIVAAGRADRALPRGPAAGVVTAEPEWRLWHHLTGGPVALDAFGPVVGHGRLVIAGAPELWVHSASGGEDLRWLDVDRSCLLTRKDRLPVYRSPVITADTLFVLRGRCAGLRDQVRAHDLAAGLQRWTLPIAGGASARSMVLADGRLLITTQGESMGLIAVDPIRGRQLWALTLQGSGLEPLTGPLYSDGAVVVAATRPFYGVTEIVTVDAATGRLVGVRRAPQQACGRADSAQLAVGPGVTVLATADGRVHVGGRPSLATWSGGVTSDWLGVGETWTITHADLGLPRPVVEDGTCRRAGVAVAGNVLYVAHVAHGTVHAVDLRSGDVLWESRDLTPDPDAPFDLTPLVTQGAVILVDRQLRPDARLVDLDRRTGEPRELAGVDRQQRSTTGRPELLFPRLTVSDTTVHVLHAEGLMGFR